MTTEEIRTILYDLHKENRAEIGAMRRENTAVHEALVEDIHELKAAFRAHEASSKAVAAIFGALGSGAFTLALAMMHIFL